MVYFCSPKFFSPSSVKPFFPTQKRAPLRKLFSKSFSPAPHFSHYRRFLFLHFILMFFYFYIRSVCFIFLFICPFPDRPARNRPALFLRQIPKNAKKGMLRPSAACNFFTSPDDTDILYASHQPDPRRLNGRHPSDAVMTGFSGFFTRSRYQTVFRRKDFRITLRRAAAAQCARKSRLCRLPHLHEGNFLLPRPVYHL